MNDQSRCGWQTIKRWRHLIGLKRLFGTMVALLDCNWPRNGAGNARGCVLDALEGNLPINQKDRLLSTSQRR
jgi:hypothetical protein